MLCFYFTGKEVIKRWGNIRDAYKKSRKRVKDATKSGAGASNIKKYIYNDQLQFLNKVFEERTTFDSLTQETENSDSTGHQSANEMEKENSVTFKKPAKQLGSRKRKNVDEVELKMLKALEGSKEAEDRHLSFFKGIIPTLHNFTDDEVVQFQLEVMQVITKIKKEQKLSRQHQQRMYQDQPVYQALHPQSLIETAHFHRPTYRTSQLSSTVSPIRVQSTAPATAASASQYYRVYGEELSSTPSSLSMDDSIDFADTDFV